MLRGPPLRGFHILGQGSRCCYFTSAAVHSAPLVGRLCSLHDVQCNCSLGLVHSFILRPYRLIKQYAIRSALGSHSPHGCHCLKDYFEWPLWLDARQVDLQRVFLRQIAVSRECRPLSYTSRDSYCNRIGWYGTTPQHCGNGCQTGYGTCSTPNSGKVSISKDGCCGGSKGYTCLGSVFGNCCSQYVSCPSKCILHANIH